MADIMMALGDFRFSVNTAAYESLRRSTEYRWAEQQRIAHRPSQQFVGIGTEEIEVLGVIYPHYKGGLRQVDAMREQAAAGKPLSLVTGTGQNLGQWAIVAVDEDQSIFATKGAPLRIEFSLVLRNYGPDQDAPGAMAFVAPHSQTSLLRTVATIPAPPALPASLPTTPITVTKIAPYTESLKAAGISQQQAASTLTKGVQRLQLIKERTDAQKLLVDKLKYNVQDLQTGLLHDPVGTMGRLLQCAGGLGAERQAVLTGLFGVDLAGEMAKLGVAMSLSQRIAEAARRTV